MFYTYILRSKSNNSYYVGSSQDVSKRLVLHNNGLVKSTKRHIPWILVYQEKHKTLLEARRRELQIKSWKKRIAIEKLFKNL